MGPASVGTITTRSTGGRDSDGGHRGQRARASQRRRLPAGRRGARDSHRARGGRLLRAGVSPRPRSGAAGALDREVRAGGHVLHALEGRQQVLRVPVRRPAPARSGRDGGAAVPLLWCAHAQGWGCRGSRMTLPAPAPGPGPWQHWDLHPSVIIGLVFLGGLYVYWGGLSRATPRRRVVSFAGALVVLGLALTGRLHTLADSYLFSPHMWPALILTLVFPPLLLYGTPAWLIRPLIRPRGVLRF